MREAFSIITSQDLEAEPEEVEREQNELRDENAKVLFIRQVLKHHVGNSVRRISLCEQ